MKLTQQETELAEYLRTYPDAYLTWDDHRGFLVKAPHTTDVCPALKTLVSLACRAAVALTPGAGQEVVESGRAELEAWGDVARHFEAAYTGIFSGVGRDESRVDIGFHSTAASLDFQIKFTDAFQLWQLRRHGAESSTPSAQSGETATVPVEYLEALEAVPLELKDLQIERGVAGVLLCPKPGIDFDGTGTMQGVVSALQEAVEAYVARHTPAPTDPRDALIAELRAMHKSRAIGSTRVGEILARYDATIAAQAHNSNCNAIDKALD